MPITTSAKKALRQSIKRRISNNTVKRTMKDSIKEFKDMVATNPDQASEMISKIYKSIDKAAKKGVIEKNTAARKKSSIARLITK